MQGSQSQVAQVKPLKSGGPKCEPKMGPVFASALSKNNEEDQKVGPKSGFVFGPQIGHNFGPPIHHLSKRIGSHHVLGGVECGSLHIPALWEGLGQPLCSLICSCAVWETMTLLNALQEAPLT